jgi:hypothetical protein
MGCDNHINSLVTDDLVEEMKVVRCVEGIVQKRVFQRELRGFIDNEAGGACLPATDMEMGDMHFVTLSQFLKDIVMTGWYRMMDIILGRNKEDLHMSHDFGTSEFSPDKWIIFSWI